MFKQIHDNIIKIGSQRKNEYERNSGLHKHHILPKHSGGLDVDENYTYLTEREHMIVHYLLWKLTKNQKDLWSCVFIKKKMYIPKEIRKQQSAKGGKVGGKKQAELGLGFHQYKTNPDLHKQWASLGGKAHRNKKTMYKPGDKSFKRVCSEDFSSFLNEGYIFGSPISPPNKGTKTNEPSPRRRKVSDGTNIYESIHDAAIKNKVTDGAIVYRCKSKKSSWHYVSDIEF